jgi:hypothetical protein
MPPPDTIRRSLFSALPDDLNEKLFVKARSVRIAGGVCYSSPVKPAPAVIGSIRGF